MIWWYSELDISHINIQWTVKGVIFSELLPWYYRNEDKRSSCSDDHAVHLQAGHQASRFFYWWPQSLIPSCRGSFQELSSHTIFDKLLPCHPEVTSKYHGLRQRFNYEFCFIVLNPLWNWSPSTLFCTGRGLVSWFTILLWVTSILQLWCMPWIGTSTWRWSPW